jgi:hypothetical protein
VGSKEIVAATSLQAKRSVANNVQQGTGPPNIARIDCLPGTETAQVTLTGGMGFAGFADNFTGGGYVYHMPTWSCETCNCGLGSVAVLDTWTCLSSAGCFGRLLTN